MTPSKAFAIALLVGMLLAGTGGFLVGRGAIAQATIVVEVENNVQTPAIVRLYVNTDLHSTLTLGGAETKSVLITVNVVGAHGRFQVRASPTIGSGNQYEVTLGPGETEFVALDIW
jgi:hypothetical protein